MGFQTIGGFGTDSSVADAVAEGEAVVGVLTAVAEDDGAG
jgi:hypothetical protein